MTSYSFLLFAATRVWWIRCQKVNGNAASAWDREQTTRVVANTREKQELGLSTRLDQSVVYCKPCGFDAIRHPQLIVDGGQMGVDRAQSNDKLFCDLLIRETGCDQA